MSSEPRAVQNGEPDPTAVHTLPELAEALRKLRGSQSYADLDRAVNVNHDVKGPRVLPASTLSNMLLGRSVPRRETLEMYLVACGLLGGAHEAWLAAWERVSTQGLGRPTGAVRVRDARPRLLGVHASIQVDSSATDLPPYVLRDLDSELRIAVGTAAAQGGFVLLVGGSSTGKTRAMYEAAKATLGNSWLIHPDPANLENLDALGAEPSARTVVWLDELQRYLDAPERLSAATIRGLISAGFVVLSTIWPSEYASRIVEPIPGRKVDPYANDRELLRLAEVIDVPEDFSPTERRRAKAMASDGRIRVAINSSDAGFTQILAAGPELVRHWENAPAECCYGKAVITAALDARRVGATAPLTPEFLAAAAPGYLSPRQQANAPADWLDQAIIYATTLLRGATSPLSPVAIGMGQTGGYAVADYLYQHARRVRRTVPLPTIAWSALVEHQHPGDTAKLAESATRRMRYQHAEMLYRRIADRTDDAQPLLRHLVDRGMLDEAFEATKKYQTTDSRSLGIAEWLAAQGRVEEALDLFRSREESFAWNHDIVDLLVAHRRIDELQDLARVAVFDQYPIRRLLEILTEMGRFADAQEFLLRRINMGDSPAIDLLTTLFRKNGRIGEALTFLRDGVRSGDSRYVERLAELLIDDGRVDEGLDLLRAHLPDKPWLNERIVRVLEKQNRIDEAIDALRQHPNHSEYRLVELLAIGERIDELRERSATGDRDSKLRLSHLLLQRGLDAEGVEVLRPLLPNSWEAGRSQRIIATPR